MKNKKTEIKLNEIKQIIESLTGNVNIANKKIVKGLLSENKSAREIASIVKLLKSKSSQKPKKEIFKAVQHLAIKMIADFIDHDSGSTSNKGIILYDSMLLPIPDGVRPATVERRQLRYRVRDSVIVISLYPKTPDSFELLGQVIVSGDSLVDRVKLKTGSFSSTISIDEYGVFRFPRVEKGNCKVFILNNRVNVGYIELEL